MGDVISIKRTTKKVTSIIRHQEGQECAMCEQAYEHTPETLGKWEQLELDFVVS
jgi:hypothetical protein